VAKVEEIMERDPVTVSPDDDVESLIRVLRQHELPGVPVVDGDGRCVGIVTESDLILRDQEADLHLPYHLDIMGGVIWLESMKHFEGRLRKAFASNVSDMMTPGPITVSADTDVAEAGRIISERGHNRLPVVDGDGRLVGVLTRVDVLAALTG
jgi:CBS domain-containing protein